MENLGEIYKMLKEQFIYKTTLTITKEEKSIRDIIAAMYQKNDIPSMDAIVLQLAKTLEANHVFIGEIQDGNLLVKTLSHCMDGVIVDGFEYTLKDTPCETVYNGKVSVY